MWDFLVNILDKNDALSTFQQSLFFDYHDYVGWKLSVYDVADATLSTRLLFLVTMVTCLFLSCLYDILVLENDYAFFSEVNSKQTQNVYATLV